jgi:hypothetical protein
MIYIDDVVVECLIIFMGWKDKKLSPAMMGI